MDIPEMENCFSEYYTNAPAINDPPLLLSAPEKWYQSQFSYIEDFSSPDLFSKP